MNVESNSITGSGCRSEPIQLQHSGRSFVPEEFTVEMCWEAPEVVPTEAFVRERFLFASLAVLQDPKLDVKSLEAGKLSVEISTDDADIKMQVTVDGVMITVQVLGDPEAAVRFCENVSSVGLNVKSRVRLPTDAKPSPYEPTLSGYLFGRILDQFQTEYQAITLSEHPVYGRAFLLDGEIQIGAKDEHLFSQGMVSHAMPERAKRVLILGGGDCGVLREVLKHPVERVVMIELDRGVVDFCSKQFAEVMADAPEDPRVEMRFEDAFNYLKNCDERFDLVLSDLPDTPIADYSLDDQVSLMAGVLSEHGVLGTHAELTRFGQPNEHEPIVEAISRRFDQVDVVGKVIPSFQDQEWLFVRASRS